MMLSATSLKRLLPLGAALLLLMATPARAGSSRNFVAQHFQPNGGYYDVLGVQGAQVAPHLRYGFWAYVNESHQIIRLIENTGGQTRNLLLDQTFVDLGGTLGLWNRVELGVALPVSLYQDGDAAGDIDPALAQEPSKAGMGDVRIMPKVIIVNDEHFKLGVGVPIGLPTGVADTYLSYQTVTVTPELLLELDSSGGMRVLFTGGYSMRPDRSFVQVHLESAITYNAALELPITDAWLILGALQGEIGMNESNSVARPVELMPAAEWLVNPDWGLLGGVGVGLTQGFGAPNWRVFLGAFWHPTEPPPDDIDHDGVLDANDRCPATPMGPRPDPTPGRYGCPEVDSDGDGVYDSTDLCVNEPAGPHPDPNRPGCPEPDSDGDGIVDSQDACPTVHHGPNPDPAKPGCPEPDSDGDGLVDSKDQCPQEPAGPTPDPNRPGCPLPDRDKDQVADHEDACPDAPGAPSRDPKKNGCPGLVKMKGTEIVTLKPIQFATGTAKLLPASFPILQGVLEAILTHPDMTLVSVEGHTDNKGKPAKNMVLSQARADACKAWLVKAGIPEARLQAKGFGQDRPIATNDTAEGRTQNRRVEFHAVMTPAADTPAEEAPVPLAPPPPPPPAPEAAPAAPPPPPPPAPAK